MLEDSLRSDFQLVRCGYLGDLTQKSGTAKDRQARTRPAAPKANPVRRHRIGHEFAIKHVCEVRVGLSALSARLRPTAAARVNEIPWSGRLRQYV